VINLGTFEFNWNGMGQLIMASSSVVFPETDQIWADDKLVIKGVGVISHQFADAFAVHRGPAIDITSILHKGKNIIMVEVVDVYGAYIGCSSLYVVQNDKKILPYDDFNRLRDIGRNITNNKDFKYFFDDFRDFPAPLPNSVESGNSCTSILKSTLISFAIGYSIDVIAWTIKNRDRFLVSSPVSVAIKFK